MIYRTFIKILFVVYFLLYLTSYSFSEISSKAWSKMCDENNTCFIAIKKVFENKESGKIQNIASAIIQIGSSKQKKMDLVNADDQTYKLSEQDKDVPILFINLPLGTDLRKKPLLVIDDKKIANLDYTHCNNFDGCKTNLLINNDVINLMKKGETMTVIMGIYRSNKNMNIQFPLKSFSKSYAALTKK